MRKQLLKSHNSSEVTLSIIVITRNESKLISQCINSIYEHCPHSTSFEVILVDSNSSDNTTSIASKYPIDIYSIPYDTLASPAAGRYVGAKIARGDYLLFIDGDVELNQNWIEDAIRILESNEDVGGVTVYHNDFSSDVGENTLNKSSEIDIPGRRVDVFGGLGLYRASTYFEVGEFDPNISGNEDFELSYRITSNGYKLIKLSVIGVLHPTISKSSESKFSSLATGINDKIRRFKLGYYAGIGQIYRKHLQKPGIIFRHMKKNKIQSIFFIWLAISLVLWRFSLKILSFWTVVTGSGIFTLMLYSKHNIIVLTLSLFEAVISIIGSTIGFKMYRDDDFPISEVKVLKKSPKQPLQKNPDI